MKTLIISLLFSSLLLGATSIEVITDKSKVEILGTSSLHDWESIVESYSIKGDIEANQITDLVATFNVESIKSGKSIMDDKAQDALKADKYPNIIFKASSLKIADGKVSGPGTLTIAGKSNPIQFAATSKISNGDMLISGSTKLKMTDYGVEPPTAMFGTLTTGDEVTVSYEIFINQ
ncbi:MAG: YceI family protein [Bacteroidota bacterium]